MKEGIEKLYENRNEFLLLGLTGRTGSGCSTVSKQLSYDIENFNIPPFNSFDFSKNKNEGRKYKITSNFTKNNWNKFYTIRIKDIITAFILENTYLEFCEYLKSIIIDVDIITNLKPLKKEYNLLHKTRIELLEEEEPKNKTEKQQKAYKFHFEQLHDFTEKLKSTLSKLDNSYTGVYQKIGNNIRTCGKAFSNDCNIDFENTNSLVKKANKLIKLIRKISETHGRKAFIVIDALRNPFEISYLKERYSAFYLLSINTKDSERIKRLQKDNYTKEQITNLDKQEYPDKLTGNDLYISQNIQKCIELADIHIYNSSTNNENFVTLKKQIIQYYSLLLKPGIIPPKAIERVMQLAYTAKLNSGCLSRQVGAAVTDKDFSIKSIGWNNSPQGQVPCILRNSQDVIESADNDAYSEYERTDSEFRNYFKETYNTKKIKDLNSCGHNTSYCFKEIQNNLDNEKNQVHTRSLHAEENAFLQLTKYGSQGVNNGILFTTASPCELCSKKAYQLGIREIYYIDPYPGIATNHILKGGDSNPNLILFTGVIGQAYFKLYNPLLPYKDEIKQRVGLKFKKKSSELDEAKKKINKLEERIKELEK
ncbi:hypothetical protein HCG49_17340 [Arenibacter sp. 6A1]|uniref:hypothetical protein n=1 Tax=Arenibacter sp. 6A1 TaxID=2720391 RepID=UPI001447374D|nr:hypothetical protein [Arenibacter sp. 6A1]NKI28319.1 hypothetical protein [Arenibacter sp. 6A1]